MSDSKKLLSYLLLAAIIAFVVWDWWSAQDSEAPQLPPGSYPGVEVEWSEAIELAEALPVRELAQAPAYERDAFGPSWPDVDGNGCDTRNDILQRDLTDITLKDDCVVLSGTLQDFYTGTTIDFVRGQGASVDIDHVVSLGDAWASGAYNLTEEERLSIANDPDNLLAVEASANRSKSDSNAAEWLPEEGECVMVKMQTLVKTDYGLTVTEEEKETLLEVLSACEAADDKVAMSG